MPDPHRAIQNRIEPSRKGLANPLAAKIRVHELAKELGLTNKETLDLAVDLGIGVKTHSSSIEDAQADRVRRKAEREGLIREVQPEEPAPQKKSAAKKAPAKAVEPAPDAAPAEPAPVEKPAPAPVAEQAPVAPVEVAPAEPAPAEKPTPPPVASPPVATPPSRPVVTSSGATAPASARASRGAAARGSPTRLAAPRRPPARAQCACGRPGGPGPA